MIAAAVLSDLPALLPSALPAVDLTTTAKDLVDRLGYPIVFFGVGIESMGIPVPGETVLVIAAALAGSDHLSPWGVALAGWLGAVVGDNIGYLVGRRWGPRLLRVPAVRRVYDERREAVAQRFFERRGWLAVFLGRFVALLRIFAGPLAGMNGMRWRTFLIANAAGGALWVGAVVTVGLLVGSNLDHAVSLVSRAGYVGLGLAILAVVAVYVVHRRRVHHERVEGERLLAERRAQTLEGEASIAAATSLPGAEGE